MVDYLNIPLFEGLSKVDVARLVPELEEVTLGREQALFRQGDPGDALFIVRAGRVQAELEGQDSVTVLERIGPGRVIGEVALLTGQPRMATIRALEPSLLWRLSRQKLDGLILKYPPFALHFNRLMGGRLMNVNDHLTQSREAVTTLGALAWGRLTLEQQAFVMQAAPLCAVDLAWAERLGGAQGAQMIADLQRLEILQETGAPELGRYAFHPAVRTLGHTQSLTQQGKDGYQAAAQACAMQADALGDHGNAVEAWLEAGAAQEALAVLVAQGERLLDEWGGVRVLGWAARCRALGVVDVALCDIEGRAAEVAGRTQVALEAYGRGLHLAAEQGDAGAQARFRAALGVLGHGQVVELAVAQGWRARLKAWWTRPGDGWRERLRPLGLLLAGGAAALAWWAAPGLGMSTAGQTLLAILGGAIVFWVLDVAPEFVTALVVCMLAVLLKVGTVEVAFSGFTHGNFFLLLAVFGFSALVARSGLAFRVALLGMRRFPATYGGQVWALAVSGLFASVLIPTVSGRLTMVGPLILAVKDTLQFRDHSRGAAGLALAAYVGYGQLSFLFMNGTAACFVIASLLPPETARTLTWGSWFLTALPLGVVVFIGTTLMVLRRFPPEIEVAQNADVLQAQLATLGKADYQEKLGLLALGGLLIIFIAKPWHNIEPAWLAMFVAALLFALGAERQMFRNIDYQYLLYFGGFLSIAELLRGAGVDTALVAFLRPSFVALAASPYIFLCALGVLAYVLMAFLPWLPSQPILMIVVTPLAVSLGYNPFVCGLVILATLVPGIAPGLGTTHLAYSIATEQRAFTLAQVRDLGVYHAAFILLGVMAAIPFWQMWGLVPR